MNTRPERVADLLIDGLAAYRLTRLARTDQLTLRWRDRIEARSWRLVPDVERLDNYSVTREGVEDVQPWAFIREMLGCAWCTSVWAAAATQLLPRRVRQALAVMALAGITSAVIEEHLS